MVAMFQVSIGLSDLFYIDFMKGYKCRHGKLITQNTTTTGGRTELEQVLLFSLQKSLNHASVLTRVIFSAVMLISSEPLYSSQ